MSSGLVFPSLNTTGGPQFNVSAERPSGTNLSSMLNGQNELINLAACFCRFIPSPESPLNLSATCFKTPVGFDNSISGLVELGTQSSPQKGRPLIKAHYEVQTPAMDASKLSLQGMAWLIINEGFYRSAGTAAMRVTQSAPLDEYQQPIWPLSLKEVTGETKSHEFSPLSDLAEEWSLLAADMLKSMRMKGIGVFRCQLTPA